MGWILTMDTKDDADDLDTLLLPFQCAMVREICRGDTLLVAGAGMRLEDVMLGLVHRYGTAKHLVLIVGVNEALCLEINRRLELHRRHYKGKRNPEIHWVTAEYSAEDRKKLYLRGGCVAVTSRILVVDLLRNCVPMHNVDGMIVWNAHTVDELSTHGFAVRLFDEKRVYAPAVAIPEVKTFGVANRRTHQFMRAMSSAPHQLAFAPKKAFLDSSLAARSGELSSRDSQEDELRRLRTSVNPLEARMRLLGVRQVCLWPRYRSEVADCLDRLNLQICEVEITMPSGTARAQRALFALAEHCLEELRVAAKAPMDRITVESGLFRDFRWQLRQELRGVALSAKARTLMNAMLELQKLQQFLTQRDVVCFLRHVKQLWRTTKDTSWATSPLARQVLRAVESRVYRIQEVHKGVRGRYKSIDSLRCLPILEPNARWNVFLETMHEIMPKTTRPVVVCTRDWYAAFALCELLTVRADDPVSFLTRAQWMEYLRSRPKVSQQALPDKTYLETQCHSHALRETLVEIEADAEFMRKYAKLCAMRRGFSTEKNEEAASAGEKRERQTTLDDYSETQQTLASVLAKIKDSAKYKGKALQGADFVVFDNKDNVIIFLVGHSALTHLPLISPRHVILLAPDTAAIRELEILQANLLADKLQKEAEDQERLNNGQAVEQQAESDTLYVHLLAYKDSAEDLRFRAQLRREHSAFDKVINLRGSATFAKVANVDLVDDDSDNTSNDNDRETSARKKQASVIVDVREFRSSLPGMLHAHGIKVVPVTLAVGDYVLTPAVCVERKSPADLRHSLDCGRLFTQATQMCRLYERPVLLVEFDSREQFGLHPGAAAVPTHVRNKDTMAQLSGLIRQFPSLRVIWSRGAAHTARLFRLIKKGEAQPDVHLAATVHDTAQEQYDTTPMDMLSKMPGVTPQNSRLLARNAGSIKQLCAASKKDLEKWIGKMNAQKLHSFMHDSALGFPDAIDKS
ncbi:MAG: hypothetical protein MHM6MM_000902 [Cercozoa sp. M6MM]